MILQNFYLGFVKKLKQAGKGDTQHREEIPDAAFQKLMELMILIQKIMRCKEKNSPEYQDLISQLPEAYRDSYHKILQWLVIFEILFTFGKRAVEGIADFTKSTFEKLYNEENDVYYWTQTVYQVTKTFQ